MKTALMFLVMAGACAAQICGDCNGDGRLTAVDALVAAEVAVGLALPATDVNLWACDAHDPALAGDLIDITILDALQILRASIGDPVILICT